MTAISAIPDFLRDQTFVAFDTETTGLWAPVNRVVEIGAVKFRLGTDGAECFQTLINPERPMPEEVIRVHGITDDMVAGAPAVAQVLPGFVEFCGQESVLIAHNAPFDISFLGWELKRSDMKFGANRILDTVDIYRRLFPGLPGYSLLSLARFFKLGTAQEHRALGDAQYVRSLFVHAIQKLEGVTTAKVLDKTLTVYRMNHALGQPVALPPQYSELEMAQKENRRVEIVYGMAGKEPTSRIIHVREIFLQGPRVYLNAFCERARAERTFRLDRVVSFKVLVDPS